MAELKLNEDLIDIASKRLDNCIYRIIGAFDALAAVKEVIFFTRKITKVRKKYCDLYAVLLRLNISAIDSEGKTKYTVSYRGKTITTDSEYEECMQSYRKELEKFNTGHEGLCCEFMRHGIENLLETLDSALSVANEEE